MRNLYFKQRKRKTMQTTVVNRYQVAGTCPRCHGCLTKEIHVSDDAFECDEYEWWRCIQCSWCDFEAVSRPASTASEQVSRQRQQAIELSLDVGALYEPVVKRVVELIERVDYAETA